MKIGIAGCGGRMGRMLIAEVLSAAGVDLAGGTEAPRSPDLGKDAAALAGHEPAGHLISADADCLFRSSDVVIDFTSPDATAIHADLAVKHGTALVIGTTGLSEDQRARVVKNSETVSIVEAGNMSLGVNLLVGLSKQVAKSLGVDYDIEIVEMHHRHKVDAPSGTALMLGEAVADGRGVNLDDHGVFVREGHAGPRSEGSIGFAVLRGGDVVGEHRVVFAGSGERVELVHKASSRQIFARGAVRAALWLKGRESGLYSMRDVLGL